MEIWEKEVKKKKSFIQVQEMYQLKASMNYVMSGLSVHKLFYEWPKCS